MIPPDAFPESSDTPSLQQVLTRYVDSLEGYRLAADLIESPDLGQAFVEVAARRRQVGERIALLAEMKGENAEMEGSAEGAIHRWWMELRQKISDEELRVILDECVRGEKVLLLSLEKALLSTELSPEETRVLQEAAAEVAMAIEHFQITTGK